MNLEKIKTVVLETVDNFVKNQFMRNPYDYLYETDLQATLFSIIRERVSMTAHAGIIRIPSTSGKIKGIDCFNLNLIYTEYGYTKNGKWEPIDIVCLDPTRVVGLEEYRSDGHQNAKYEPLWDQPLLIGIELKYSMSSKYCNLEDCIRDLQKMQRYQVERNTYSPNFCYLVVCFVQDDWSMAGIEKNANERFKKVSSMSDYNRVYFISEETIFQLIQ